MRLIWYVRLPLLCCLFGGGNAALCGDSSQVRVYSAKELSLGVNRCLRQLPLVMNYSPDKKSALIASYRGSQGHERSTFRYDLMYSSESRYLYVFSLRALPVLVLGPDGVLYYDFENHKYRYRASDQVSRRFSVSYGGIGEVQAERPVPGVNIGIDDFVRLSKSRLTSLLRIGGRSSYMWLMSGVRDGRSITSCIRVDETLAYPILDATVQGSKGHAKPPFTVRVRFALVSSKRAAKWLKVDKASLKALKIPYAVDTAEETRPATNDVRLLKAGTPERIAEAINRLQDSKCSEWLRQFEMTGVPLKASPLVEAARTGNVKAVSRLLSRGGRPPKVQGILAYRLVHDASALGEQDIVELLLKHGFTPEAPKSANGFSPLLAACGGGHTKTALLLLDKGASIKPLDTNGATALHFAQAFGLVEVSSRLIKMGADVEAKDKDGQSPIFKSAAEGQVKALKAILKQGAVADAVDAKRNTPLFHAVAGGHEAVVKALLSSGANLKHRNKGGQSVLHVAVIKGRDALLDLFLKRGADVDTKTSWGGTPLLHAAALGRRKCATMLLDKRADINVQVLDGSTPLFMAAKRGDKMMTKLLLSRGAKVLARKDGSTVLHAAAQAGDVETVKLLVSKGCGVDSTTRAGGTPLHIAAFAGHLDLVKYLLTSKANVHAKDKAGDTPLDCAVSRQHTEVAELLRKHGARAGSKLFEPE
jgi:ankyrin repeat protein